MDPAAEGGEVRHVPLQEVQPRPQPQFLNRGDVVRDRYQILEKIGQGAFGEIFSGIDIKPPGEEVAIKCEPIDNKKMVLRLEVMALKCLQSCPHVVRYITSGRHNNTINYLVMERLGKNLADVRKEMPQGEFSFSTSLRFAINMLQGIEGVHELGYVHRDIKPSNFVLGKGENRWRCFLIDFGLARKYRTENGEIRPPRLKAGFRGTTRYASIASHQGKELGRVDDLWSLFYLLVEFVLKELPWRRKKEKDDILALKEAYSSTLVNGLPDEFRLFQNHLISLAYEDAPNYTYLRALLHSMLDKNPSGSLNDLDSLPTRAPDSARGLPGSRKKSMKQKTDQSGGNTRAIGNPTGGQGMDRDMLSEVEAEEVVVIDTPLTKPTGGGNIGSATAGGAGIANTSFQTPRRPITPRIPGGGERGSSTPGRGDAYAIAQHHHQQLHHQQQQNQQPQQPTATADANGQLNTATANYNMNPPGLLVADKTIKNKGNRCCIIS
eukprot:PhF_6_TR33710/c0_g1_i1/m.49469/K08815/TTBK; tau tubulin kinase